VEDNGQFGDNEFTPATAADLSSLTIVGAAAGDADRAHLTIATAKTDVDGGTSEDAASRSGPMPSDTAAAAALVTTLGDGASHASETGDTTAAVQWQFSPVLFASSGSAAANQPGIVQVGSGTYTTILPDGATPLTDSTGHGGDGKNDPTGGNDPTKDPAYIPNKPVHPAVTDDYTGAPDTNSIFAQLDYHQYNGFTGWMNTGPINYVTEAKGLGMGYTPDATVATDGSGYHFNAFESLTLGLDGLNASQTRLAGEGDWSATADWDGKMRATMVEGGLFTYVTRTTNDDVVIDLHQEGAPDAHSTPFNPLTYVASGLNGTYNAASAVKWNIPVTSNGTGDGIAIKISYDFDGDGKIDRTELYDWFATDASNTTIENYGTKKLISATGAPMQNMANGSVKVELWNANGSHDVSINTDAANSFVSLPFDGLTGKNGVPYNGGTFYFQHGAKAAGVSGVLGAQPGATPGTDTTHVDAPASIGGYKGPGYIWYQQDGVVGLTINGVSYGIFGPPGSVWTYTSTGLRSNLGGQDYYSVAALPDASLSTLMDFRQHAYAFVTDTKSSYVVDKDTGTLTTTFTYTTQMKSDEPGLSKDPITAMYSHQYENTDAQTADFSYNGPRGEMKGFEGSTFSTTLKMPAILPIMPFIGTDAQKADLQGLLHDQLKSYLADPNGGAIDSYWGSRKAAKYADLAVLGQQLGYGQARDTFLNAAEKYMESLFNATDGDKLTIYYDAEWKSLVVLPGSYDNDDKKNDGALQVGYLIKAASEIAMLDPDWASQSRYGGMVNLLIKDVDDWMRNDPQSPFLRDFDPYAEHNWASGTGNGITEESGTEALNFDSAVAMWGAATSQSDVENLGLYLYTSESDALSRYWLNTKGEAFPDGYDKPRVGILGGDGGSYTTYFGTDPNYVEGINMTPILPSNALFMGYDQQDMLDDLAYYDNEPQEIKDRWWSAYTMYEAMVRPDQALTDINNHLDYQGGGEESPVYSKEFIESFVAMGTIDADVTANSPYAAVFQKNGVKSYVAWNPTGTDTSIKFSDGTVIQVPAGDMATQDSSGVLHVQSFQGGNLPTRPDGIPLDLPTDPPQYTLTTVATNGTMTLSSEANTGTAWISVDGGQPRAIYNGNNRVALTSGNNTLIAVGRDPATGKVHVLLSGNGGKEPYYDKILSDNFNLSDNGGALYNVDYAKLEPLFGRDFNGDGIVVGGPTNLVTQNGKVQLLVDGGDGRAYVKDGDNAMVEVHLDPNGPASLLTRGGSTLIGVGKDSDGNLVVLDKGTDGSLTGWTLNAVGKELAKTTYTSANISTAEAVFQKDLNGDGVIPAPLPQVVAKNGALKLMTDAQGDALIQLEDGSIINVQRGGANVVLGHGSTLFAVGRDASGALRVMDGNVNDGSAGSTHWAWKLDAKGNYVTQDVVSGSQLASFESIFNQDLNHDGVITGGTSGSTTPPSGSGSGSTTTPPSGSGSGTGTTTPPSGSGSGSTTTPPSSDPAKTILFVGNSFTYGEPANGPNIVLPYGANTVTDLNGGNVGGVPALFKAMTVEAGLNYNVSLITDGGQDLAYHYNNELAKIDKPWDAVVLQDYSALNKNKAGDPSETIKYTGLLADALHQKNSNVSVYLDSTWSRADLTYQKASPWNGQGIDAMEKAVEDGYRQAKAASPYVSDVLAVGAAWNAAIQKGIADGNPYDSVTSGVDLWAPDGQHASVAGYYLEALVEFGGITKVDPLTLGTKDKLAAALGLDPALAGALQEIAHEQLGFTGTPPSSGSGSTSGSGSGTTTPPSGSGSGSGTTTPPSGSGSGTTTPPSGSGSGTTGANGFTIVAQNDGLTLLVDPATGLAYVQDGTNAPMKVYRNAGQPASMLTRSAYSLSAIGRDAEGNIRVLDYAKGTGVSYAWELNAKGVWVDETKYTKANNSEAEEIFQKDLNGDGKIDGMKLVAQNGSLRLFVDAAGLAYVQDGDGPRTNVYRNAGQPASMLTRSAYSLSAIGRDAQGNIRVLDYAKGTGVSYAWELNAKGVWVDETKYTKSNNAEAEGMFNFDVNHDGKIDQPTVTGTSAAATSNPTGLNVVSVNGDDTLFTDAATGTAYISVHGAAPIAVTRDGWGDVQTQRSDSGLVAIATDSQGRTRLLDANPFAKIDYAWILDAKGHWAGEESFATTSSSIGTAELLFSTDLNGDGVIGNKVAHP
jgi:hypothetical protein